MRAVNARGLDIRTRVPDWLEGLDQILRTQVSKALTRGNVTISIKLARDQDAGEDRISPAGLTKVLAQLAEIEAVANTAGVALAPTTPADILTLRGVLTTQSSEEDSAQVTAAVSSQLPEILAAFQQMRRAEGAELAAILSSQLDQIAELTQTASDLANKRKEQWAKRLHDMVKKVIDVTKEVDTGRLEQELALIAVKTDVTEEIDRLTAHVTTARALIASDGPIGRKLDFLSQEFNREANTLCSKSQSTDLTRVGLDLKAVIDQMREQVQNVE